MRILWLNWRDIKNPQAGGAEVMTHETAKRLVKNGHQVTIFTAKFPGARSKETIDGIKILRRGNRLTCRYWAYRIYSKDFKQNIDLVVDEINTIPFFTNFYVKEKKIALIHQLAKEYWWSETFFPLNLFGYLLEPLYLKPYKNIVTIAASYSTKKDLEGLGFKKVFVFHQGLSVKPLSKAPPNKTKDILFIGRLIKPKGPQDAIYAFSKINEIFPDSRLTIVGKGRKNFTSFLKHEVRTLGLSKHIKFEGFVSQKRKEQLLKKATLILLPSQREGWNLVPIEANAFGAIPIGYSVAGLKDSIRQGQTGILTAKNPGALAKASIALLKNRKKQNSLVKKGLVWANNFSWKKTYDSFSKIIASLHYRILWLSWRDIKNPAAGGAERVAIETAKRFAKNKIHVTIFTSSFAGAKDSEIVDGVNIRRQGNLLTCHIHAFFYYLKNKKGIDMIVDEINTIPFFSVLYSTRKTVVLIHQLAREYWGNLVNWPFSLIGEKIEPLVLSFYKKRPTMVVSPSTHDDLKKLNFENIKIIREGLDLKPQLAQKSRDIILYLGRLTPAKGPQDAIEAFHTIHKQIPTSELVIAGTGTWKFTQALKKLAQRLKIKNIKFAGFVKEAEKINLLRKSKIVLIPSVREGWNLVAIEAMSQGAVPIAYNVPGLKDSIKNGKTGILTAKNPQALAQGSISLLNDNKRRITLSQNGFAYSQKFSWENTYDDIRRFIFKE